MYATILIGDNMTIESFDKPVQNFVRDFAAGVDCAEEDFVERLVINFMAQIEAWGQARHGVYKMPLMMLAKHDGKRLQGRPLFEALVGYHLASHTVQPAPTPESHEAHKEQLTDFNTMKMEQGRGRIPADYKGAPGPALRWLSELDAGEITQEMLTERFEHHKRSAGWQGADDGEK